ncbi:MAG: hypothetical protein P0107_03210 [Nitrosomonas sp.]|nr:hypothetical protein [Nitrosomonas sp.]
MNDAGENSIQARVRAALGHIRPAGGEYDQLGYNDCGYWPVTETSDKVFIFFHGEMSVVC